MKVVKSPHHALLYCGPHGNMTVVPLVTVNLSPGFGHTPRSGTAEHSGGRRVREDQTGEQEDHGKAPSDCISARVS